MYLSVNPRPSRGPKNPKPQATAGSVPVPPFFDKRCRLEREKFAERFKFLPDDHPVARYINSLPIVKANPDIKFLIPKKWDELNAFSMPDGTIVIGKKLIALCEFQEELEFVLRHELQHIRERHAESDYGWSTPLAKMGENRINEYRADLNSILDSKEESRINPHGGILFLRKIAEMEKGSSDAAHGATYARLINAEHSIRLVDLDALNDQLHAMPADIRAQLKVGKDPWAIFRHLSDANIASALKAADGLGPIGAFENYRSAVGSNLSKDNKELLKGKLVKKIEELIEERFPDSPEEAKDACAVFIKIAAGDRSLGRMKVISSPVFFTSFQDILKRMGQLPLNIPIEEFLKTFDSALEYRISKLEPVAAYECAKNLSSAMKQGYGVDVGFAKQETACAILLLNATPKDKSSIDAYLSQAFSEFPSVDPIAIFDNVCRYHGLSKEEALKLKQSRFFKEKEKAVEDVIDFTFAPNKFRVPISRILSIGESEARTGGSDSAISLSKSIIQAISPQSLDDFLDFLDSYCEAFQSRSQKGLLDKGDALGGLMHHFPEAFFNELSAYFGQATFTKKQSIALISCLEHNHYLFDDDTGTFQYQLSILGLGKGGFSEDELRSISQIGQPAIFLFALKNQLKDHVKDRDGYFRFLKSCFEIISVNKNLNFNDLQSYSAAMIRMEAQFAITDAIALESFKRFKFNLEDPKHLDQLLSLSFYIRDPNLKMRVQKTVLPRLASRLPVDDAYKILFNDRRVADYGSVDAREELLDRFVDDPERLRAIEKSIVERLNGIEEQSVGKLVLGEGVLDNIMQDKGALFKALLLTRSSNLELRSLVCRKALEKVAEFHLGDTNVETQLSTSDDLDDALDDISNLESKLERYMTESGLSANDISDFEKYLYTLDYEGRHVIAQQILIGKDGILLEEGSRSDALKWFFDNFVEPPSTEAQEKVHEFLALAFTAVARKSDVTTLYFLTHPIIIERMLGKPEQTAGWDDAVEKAKADFLASNQNRYGFNKKDFKKITERYADFLRAYLSGAFSSPYEGYLDEDYGIEREKERMMQKDGDDRTMFSKLSSICLEYTFEVPDRIERMSPVEFVKHISSKMGAPGVRFLQSLGLYADLPEELRREFDDVYDNVKGQLKLSAFHTVDKATNGEAVLKQRLERFGPRAGGGSLVSVYSAVVDGKPCALKVVNPNVAYRAGAICDNLNQIFSSEPRLERAVPIVENIRRWISADTKFDGARSLEDFKRQNEGFSVEGNPYRIHVPSLIHGGKKAVAEEFVHGRNLTKWHELKLDYDMKQVVSLITKNVVHQIGNGLVHADIHVGNIRIMEPGPSNDGKSDAASSVSAEEPMKGIAWLDNNYLIALSEHDKEFIGSLVFLANDKPALAHAISDYLCGFEENSKMDKDALGKRLEVRLTDSGKSDISSFISDVSAIVTEHNGTIPLNVMLLAKNALALDRMAKRAGFAGALEAFQY